jgi:hypothetical protein
MMKCIGRWVDLGGAGEGAGVVLVVVLGFEGQTRISRCKLMVCGMHCIVILNITQANLGALRESSARKRSYHFPNSEQRSSKVSSHIHISIHIHHKF